jgi:hypothetical protein
MNERIWIIGRMILEWKIFPSANMSITNHMLTGMQTSILASFLVFAHLCQNVVLCTFLANASKEFVYKLVSDIPKMR